MTYRGNYDSLGFTEETDALLTGLNCTNLKGFKKRRINLDDLRKLTDEDLATLEVGDEFDYESFQKLKQSLKRKYDKNLPKPGVPDAVKIIKNTHKEMKAVLIYLKYTYIQLSQNREDYFIEEDKNMKISEALFIACKSVLQNVEELERAVMKLRTEKSKPKTSVNSKEIKYTLVAAGIGVIIVFCIFR